MVLGIVIIAVGAFLLGDKQRREQVLDGLFG